jgi:ArsR family transcriptional regulator
MMKALTDETRLRILNILLERESCVCETMQALGISQSSASRNLGILYDTGFLRLRRDGTWVFYSIDETEEFYVELVGLVRKALKDDKVLEADKKRLKETQRIIAG